MHIYKEKKKVTDESDYIFLSAYRKSVKMFRMFRQAKKPAWILYFLVGTTCSDMFRKLRKRK